MVISDLFLMSFDETRISHSFENLGSHAQITEMKFNRTRVFLSTELPATYLCLY